MNRNKILIVVAGPTASGKTALAIELALHFNTEIISADSRQFFRELTIGTAKPTPEELSRAPHHFINSHSVSENFNAGDYGTEARKLIDTLFLKHDVLIMAGGSGLYIDAAVKGFDELPSASEEIRQELEAELNEKGIEALRNRLKEADPVSYSKIDLNNPRRIIRAIEATETAGIPYSELLNRKEQQPDWKILYTGIDLDRDTLYERINLRVDRMILQGLEAEARSVYAFRDLNALKTVGYREMFSFIEGKSDLSETVELIKKNTRNYAKRQLTWFRKYEPFLRIKEGETEKIIRATELLTSD